MKNMFPAFMLLVAFWLFVFNLDCTAMGDGPGEVLPLPSGCMSCTKCQYPCYPLSPPPQSPGYPLYGTPPPPPSTSGYPSYGAAPPPPPPPSSSGYPAYGAPQPPLPAKDNCPPPPPVECCDISPPSTYTYLPDQNHSAHRHSPLLAFVLMLLLPFG